MLPSTKLPVPETRLRNVLNAQTQPQHIAANILHKGVAGVNRWLSTGAKLLHRFSRSLKYLPAGGDFGAPAKKITVLFTIGLLPLLASAANSAPKVDGGPARQVVAPASTTTLNGSGSDAEGPVTFQWTQVRGNSTAVFAKPTSAVTAVSSLVPGSYTFKLTVKDNSGTTRFDTVTVSVFQKLTWTINGIKREALVHPATGGSGAAPVMFAFHGHGGTDTGYAQKGFETSWPEAVVVYPQGVRTKGVDDSLCKKSGWQSLPGEVNCYDGVLDQDIKFFDSMLNTLKKKYNINSSLVFVHGWSNGADFIYNVLWRARRDKIAALGPAGGNMDTTFGKKAIPVIHTVGTQDEKVPFEEQQRDVQNIRTLNKCSPSGTVWATGPSKLLGTKYASPINDPVVFLQYEGPHSYPYTVPPLIVRFFKEVAASITAKTNSLLITKATINAEDGFLSK